MMFRNLFCVLFFGALAAGCSSIKPYEKEFLLNPLMDDGEVGKLTCRFGAQSAQFFEKIAVGGASLSGGSSCPTCGG